MESFWRTLRKNIKGEVSTGIKSRRLVSRDSSIYELMPAAIVNPKDTADVAEIVRLVLKNKTKHPNLSLTPRSGGYDTGGGSIGDSIIINMAKNFNEKPTLKTSLLRTQPGVSMFDIKNTTRGTGLQLRYQPKNGEHFTIGGSVANNSGNLGRDVTELTVILGDGNPYTIKPLTKKALSQKIKEGTYESKLYKQLFDLIDDNYDTIRNARPKSPKNSMGYNLWSVWDRDTGVFDLTQLFVGSQGTLGIITEITIATQPRPAYRADFLIELPSLRHFGQIANIIGNHKPLSIAAYDSVPFLMRLKYGRTLHRQLGLRQYLKGRPGSMTIAVEFGGRSEPDVLRKISNLYEKLAPFNIVGEVHASDLIELQSKKIQRSNTTLARSQVHGRQPLPLIDDMSIAFRFLPKFIPELRRLIRKHKLPAIIQGDLNDGTVRVVPVVDILGTKHQDKIEELARELIPIVLKYDGSMAGDSNDGMLRGAWLPAVFGSEMYDIFRQTKEIFDPSYIFNPYKKTDASWDFSKSHTYTKN